MTAPKLRFKEFGSEYNEYNLGKLLKSYRLGGNYSNSEIKTNLPLIKMGNLNRGSINLSKIEYIPSNEIIDDQDQIQLGDLFFNTRNTLDLVGKVAIWRNELPVAYYNSNLMRLEFENNFYMNFLLNTEKSLEKLKAIASGTTSVAAIYTKDLLKVKVKIPFVDEQTKIASFLSSVDEKISQLTQKHELLSQYKQGMMQKLFSQQIRFKADDGSEFGEWVESKITDVADYVDYRGKTPKKVEDGILLVTAKNIRFGYIDYSVSQEYICSDDFDEVMRRGRAEIGDVLITTEAPLGNVASVDRENIALAQRVIKYRGKKGILNNEFLKQKFLSEEFQSLISSKATGGTVQGIKGSTLHNLEIHIPEDIEEQTKIANFLSAIDQKIEVVAQQIEQAKTWKKGLLQQMFV